MSIATEKQELDRHQAIHEHAHERQLIGVTNLAHQLAKALESMPCMDKRLQRTKEEALADYYRRFPSPEDRRERR